MGRTIKIKTYSRDRKHSMELKREQFDREPDVFSGQVAKVSPYITTASLTDVALEGSDIKRYIELRQNQPYIEFRNFHKDMIAAELDGFIKANSADEAVIDKAIKLKDEVISFQLYDFEVEATYEVMSEHALLVEDEQYKENEVTHQLHQHIFGQLIQAEHFQASLDRLTNFFGIAQKDIQRLPEVYHEGFQASLTHIETMLSQNKDSFAKAHAATLQAMEHINDEDVSLKDLKEKGSVALKQHYEILKETVTEINSVFKNITAHRSTLRKRNMPDLMSNSFMLNSLDSLKKLVEADENATEKKQLLEALSGLRKNVQKGLRKAKKFQKDALNDNGFMDKYLDSLNQAQKGLISQVLQLTEQINFNLSDEHRDILSDLFREIPALHFVEALLQTKGARDQLPLAEDVVLEGTVHIEPVKVHNSLVGWSVTFQNTGEQGFTGTVIFKDVDKNSGIGFESMAMLPHTKAHQMILKNQNYGTIADEGETIQLAVRGSPFVFDLQLDGTQEQKIPLGLFKKEHEREQFSKTSSYFQKDYLVKKRKEKANQGKVIFANALDE